MKWTAAALIPESRWLNNIKLPLSFANGIQIDLLPKEYKTLYSHNDLGTLESDRIRNVNHAFLFPYEATSTRGFIEPMQGNRSMFAVANHTISLANLALWISKPNGIAFVAILHLKHGGGTLTCEYSRARRFIPHMDYMNEPFQYEDFNRACDVFKQLLSINNNGTTWRAVYSLLTALRESDWATRFMQVWMGLEALFGPEDRREISFRISQRIAFFLESDMIAAKALFRDVKKSYDWRSKVVHGLQLAKLNQESARKLSLFVETLTARVLFKELSDPNIVSLFESADRESYLDDLVFQN